MSDLNISEAWYHGSPQRLTRIRAGSSITQNRDIARIFSHRPAIVSMEENGEIKHNGKEHGYLFLIDEEISPDDLYPHPHPINAEKWEWLITRDLAVHLLQETEPLVNEFLTEEDLNELRQKQSEAGVDPSNPESFRID